MCDGYEEYSNTNQLFILGLSSQCYQKSSVRINVYFIGQAHIEKSVPALLRLGIILSIKNRRFKSSMRQTDEQASCFGVAKLEYFGKAKNCHLRTRLSNYDAAGSCVADEDVSNMVVGIQGVYTFYATRNLSRTRGHAALV